MVDCANRTVRRILEVGRRWVVDWVLILKTLIILKLIIRLILSNSM